jgi:hypothetical protein
MKERDGMHPENDTDKGVHYFSYVLTKAKKKIFFECLRIIKVPSSFSSKINRIINMVEKSSKTQSLMTAT